MTISCCRSGFVRAGLRRFALFAGLVLVFGPADASAQRRADLSRLVVVGDSLSAGFQNLSLLDSQQVHGYANLIAKQANVPLVLPLIASPGVPNVLQLKSLGPPLPIIQPAPGVSPGRTNPTVQATNLAVPGAKVRDALRTRPDLPVDSLTDLVLGLPGLLPGVGISRTQVEWAQALRPTTVVLWIGNNDVLMPALEGTTAGITNIGEFALSYAELMGRIVSTGASVVVANIPDVTLVAAFTSPEEIAALSRIPVGTVRTLLGIAPGSLVRTDALPRVLQILANPATGRLTQDLYLDPHEVSTIRWTIRNYNLLIEIYGRMMGAAVVDIHELVGNIDRNGYTIGGQTLTTAFLGGLFSLDGVHPTNTGYGIIANEFIRTINRRFDTNIPLANLVQIKSSDPLVPPIQVPAP